MQKLKTNNREKKQIYLLNFIVDNRMPNRNSL